MSNTNNGANSRPAIISYTDSARQDEILKKVTAIVPNGDKWLIFNFEDNTKAIYNASAIDRVIWLGEDPTDTVEGESI